MNRINKKIIASAIAIGIAVTATFAAYSESIQESISNKVIRLHILANSNSPEDQNLKLLVRDRILKESGSLFSGAVSPKECDAVLSRNIEKLKTAAEDEISKNGYTYSVNISRGRYSFPMKIYEGFALPSGEYDAVRIEIGEGEGENWWCVMFPPLCFVDAAVDHSAVEVLSENLTEEELSLITANSGVNIRFKVVDFFQSSISTIKTALKK